MRTRLAFPLLIVAAWGFCAAGLAGEGALGKPKQPAPDVVEMTLHPAHPPRPALKYRLLPQFVDQTSGNAAPMYMKAALHLAQANLSDETWEKVNRWGRETPPDQLPLEEVRGTLEQVADALHHVELGARRNRCDWDLPIRDEENVLEISLIELQPVRNLERLLGLQARFQIAQGELDEAVGTLQTGYAMAAHIGKDSTLVSGLVGMASADIMTHQVETLIQLPDAPNLYWPITALPHPLVDLRDEFHLEEAIGHLLFPELREAKHAELSPGRSQALLDQFVAKCNALAELASSKDGAAQRITPEQLIEIAYPTARQSVIARGRSEQEVDAMPQVRVLLIHALEGYEELRDELFKWSHVPYWQSLEGIEQAQARLAAEGQKLENLPIASLLLPALGKARSAVAKTQRNLDALRCIEAIRLYAAGHDGNLPERLGDVTEVPIPTNPATGKPFPYRLEGTTAILDAGGPPETSPRQYRLKMAR